MKSLVLLLLTLACLSCDAKEPPAESKADQQLIEAVEDAKAAATKAVKAVSGSNLEDYRVSTKTYEHGIEYFRRGEPIMFKPDDYSVYKLVCSGRWFATVFYVQKIPPPEIVIEPNLDFRVILTHRDDGSLELSAYGTDPEILEVYEITNDSVVPVKAERFMEHLIQMRGSRAAFESIADALLESTEGHEKE